jgi:hypothetical protein
VRPLGPGCQETDRELLAGETPSVPQPGGFDGFVPVSEGLFSHHPPVLDREEEGELISIHGDLAGGSHSRDLSHRDYLVSRVDQLDGINRVPGQGLLVLL